MEHNYRIEQAAREFWTLAGGASSYPGDMEAAITLASPLEVYPLPELRVSNVRSWLRRLRMTHTIRGRDRRLHGCLIAYNGKGTIFVDAQDTEDERRFTLAHELAHFLLDYQEPRQRAVAILGENILPVLDGLRKPTLEERVHAVLSEISLGIMSHFMERPESGLPAGPILDSEDQADRLALELLAPADPLFDLMSQPTSPRGYTARLAFLREYLQHQHGLPEAIAAAYARLLLAQLGEPTFRDWLSGDL